ncbi:MAG TPA: VOC family protein [Mycobacteriales bacterium]|nr:VOC family protein [Mycobacteriales bacterium]
MTAAAVNHVGHCVSDLERAKRFYVGAFGFTPWFEISPPDEGSDTLLGLSAPLGMTASYLRLGDVVLELLSFSARTVAAADPPRTMDQVGLTHFSFAVDDIAETCATVAELGGTVLDDTNIGVAVFVRDPDGQLIELLPMGYRAKLPPFPA